MDDQLYLKPAPGRVVRDPVTMEPLAEAGEYKPRTAYWLRRLKEGDVVAGTPSVEATTTAGKGKGEK